MGMLDDVKDKKKKKAAENWMKMASSAKTIEKQIEYYTKALDVDPYNGHAWFQKGKALENLGRFEEARKCFELAIEIDPDYQGLVGKKYESTAAHEVHPEPSVMEEQRYEEQRSREQEYEEKEYEEREYKEQWPSETPAPVSEDEAVTQEEYSSFKSPSEEESAFSGMIVDDDNGSPSPVREAEADDEVSIFAAVSNGIEKEHVVDEEEVVEEGEKEMGTTSAPSPSKEEPSAFTSYDDAINDDNVISETKEPVNKEPASVMHDSISSVSYDEKTASKPLPKESRVPAAEYRPSHEAISRPAAPAISGIKSGVEPMDIKIPITEAIKFWAIGIVAMLIVMLLSSLILG